MKTKDFKITKNYGDVRYESVFVNSVHPSGSITTERIELPIIDRGVVMFAAEDISLDWNKFLKNVSERCRVYILTHIDNKSRLANLKGSCMIRTGVQQNGCALIWNQGNAFRAWIFPDSKTENPTYEMSESESENAYRTFCRLFWTKADREYLDTSDSTKITEDRDISIALNETICLPDASVERIFDYCGKNIKMTAPVNNIDNLYPFMNDSFECDELTLIRVNNAPLPKLDGVSSKVRKTSIKDCSHSLFMSVRSESNTCLLPNCYNVHGVNWIGISSNSEVKKYAEFGGDSWDYNASVNLSNLGSGSSFFRADKPNQVLNVESCINRSITYSAKTIDDFLNFDASNVSESDCMMDYDKPCLTSEITVTVNAPVLPSDAKIDKLVTSWDKLENDFKTAISTLIEKCEQLIKNLNVTSVGCFDVPSIKTKISANTHELNVIESGCKDIKTTGLISAARFDKQYKTYCELFYRYLEPLKLFENLNAYIADEKRRSEEQKRLMDEINSLDDKIKSADKKDKQNLVNLNEKLNSRKEKLKMYEKPIDIEDSLSKILKNVHEPVKLTAPSECRPTLGGLYSLNGSRYFLVSESLSADELKPKSAVRNEAELYNAEICFRG